MKKLIIAGVVAVSLVAGVASAQSYYPTYTTGSTYSSGACVSISSYLSVGSRGSQVLALQQFLVSQNYPGSGTWMETGYFGAATRAALIDFQQSQGLSQTGVVDSATISALERVSCGVSTSYITPSQPYSYPGYPGYTGTTYPYGTTYPNTYTYPYNYNYGYNNYSTPTITSLSQNTGTQGQVITIYGQGFQPSNTVYFNGVAVSSNSVNGSTAITFTIPYVGGYTQNQTVTLYVTNSGGTSNSVSFTLNPSIANTCGSYSYGYNYNNCGCNTYPYNYSYGPCGNCNQIYQSYPYTYNNGCPSNTNSPTITYLSPQSGGVGTNVTVYGSGFTTGNNTVHFGNGVITGLQSSDGQSISFQVPSQISGFGSSPLTLGTYNISVTNSNNISSNALPFTVTSTGSSSGAPTITSVSGPTNLATGQQGTWTFTVNTQGNTYTTVSAYWGDTGNGYVNQAAPQVLYGTQIVTFTHAYVLAGSYTLSFTVANSAGQSNSYTSTINVSGSGNSYGTPSINMLSPNSAYVGSQVTISGSNFATNGTNTVNFGTGTIQNVYSNGNSITFTVPSFTTQYCAPGLYCGQVPVPVSPGTYNISVMNQYGTSNTLTFTVL